ncbi:MAG: hypothetical protein A2Z45_01235 [Chloroflexi bacterium RBG_19FT_COMBO_55_16]|nr:MAG: hypothetical protein A2Z45_01235 [Chloroflexi bacterium RBG_19FT_COMBO_55_16]
MYNSDTEFLFPLRVIPTLAELRGEAWCQLVEAVTGSEATSQQCLAFVLLMIRLARCTSCHANSFRALRGCTQCARQVVRRFRGEDQALVDLFNQAKQEIAAYLERDRPLAG